MTVSVGDGKGSKSPLKILANIFISFIGAGVLGLPYAFKEVIMIKQCISRFGYWSNEYLDSCFKRCNKDRLAV